MDSDIRLTLRLPVDLHTRLTLHAKRERRSLNADLVYLLECALPTVAGVADPTAGEPAAPARPGGRPGPPVA
ncbi:toxin-antitoxin system HicB family antitoxin [Streptomyces sp. NPDC048142]|uniref:toxin-antitoxin system HicB family antitoxin n=1 Tax=Streptomyces sp. NPDC048142 TaxID=3365501 RepID=UPI0037106603